MSKIECTLQDDRSKFLKLKFDFSNSILQKYEFAEDVRSLANLFSYIGLFD